MKLFKYADRRTVLNGLLISCGAILVYCLLSNLGAVKGACRTLLSYVSPVTSGLILAYVLRPFTNFLDHLLSKRIRNEKLVNHISSITAVLVLVLVIVFLLSMVLPQLLASVTSFAANLDDYITSAKEKFDAFLIKIGISNVNLENSIGTRDELLDSLVNWASSNLDYLLSTGYAIGSQLFNIIIVVAMALYALLDRRNIKKGLLKLETAVLRGEKMAYINDVLARGDALMMKFLSSNLLDALIVLAANLIFLGVMRAPYRILLSVFLGAANLIPTFGPIVGGCIAAFVVLLTDPSLLIIFIVFTFVLQQIDGNVIKPVLFGDSTGLSPFWVLVAIIVGGKVFGVIGMIVGIPLMALFASLYSEIIEARLRKIDKTEPADK